MWGKWIYACKACCIIKIKTRGIIFNNAACFRFNNAACFNNAVCRFSTCEITPDNFSPTKKDHICFSHTVCLHYFSLHIRWYNADRKQWVWMTISNYYGIRVLCLKFDIFVACSEYFMFLIFIFHIYKDLDFVTVMNIAVYLEQKREFLRNISQTH